MAFAPPGINLFAIVTLLPLSFWILYVYFRGKHVLCQVLPKWITNSKHRLLTPNEKHIDKGDVIEPLADYDVWKVDPINYRPYRSPGHVVMGVTRKSRNDWIHIDHLYLEHIRERERLIKQYPEATICAGPLVNPAIEELYLDVMVDYLPKRYPTIFKVTGETVLNVVTGSTYPLSITGLAHEEMLQHLGVNVEDDFFFMCPDELDGEYRLQGCVACFPNGFLGPGHLGHSVRQIHQAVPGYEERLGNGVDKYFQRMKPNVFVGRMNWSLQVDGPDLFRTEGLNYYPHSDQVFSEKMHNPSFDKCFLRVEHQTMVRLPRTRTIMFCVHSYMTSLEQIKKEGDGPWLAASIESMPEMLGLYKMRHFWSEKVLPWLKEDQKADFVGGC